MATQLVRLPEIEKLRTRRLLIDTGQGLPAWSRALKSILAQEKATISSAFITHWHHDHISGISDLKKTCPGVRIFKHDPDKDDDGNNNDDGELFPIEDGDVFQSEGVTLEAIYSPGHTIDHMSFWLKEENSMFTGDSVLGQGTSVFEELGPYLSSLKKLQKKGAIRGYPGHGPVIENPDSKISEYLDHRKKREDQILQLLQSMNHRMNDSLWSPRDLAEDIYSMIPKEVMLSAVNGIVQVLMKLEDEGRAVRMKNTGLWKVPKARPTLVDNDF
ncbi:hypothetical protein KEM54_005273 [Ascosphaera aggregata]|nr:hypothetical protein KEM54_005273 [Ascosphaera aggregata]